MVRTKLVRKRTIRWLPKERYTQHKIKTLLPEENFINIKKNGEVVRTVRVRRKTIKFTDRWARNFFKKWTIGIKITIKTKIQLLIILQISNKLNF